MVNKVEDKKLKSLGEQLKKIRIEKGLTLKELGYKIDKDPQSISRVEMGNINPTYLYLLDLCTGLDVKLSEVLKDID
jgi:transcriptional regulator with XRE-family HTH domain